jgi:hypothetical protein
MLELSLATLVSSVTFLALWPFIRRRPAAVPWRRGGHTLH